MNTIIINDTYTVEVLSFNKTTNFNTGDETVYKTGYMNIVTPNITGLYDIADEGITSIEIKHDDTTIYNATDLVGHVDSINEYLNGDRITIDVQLRFE